MAKMSTIMKRTTRRPTYLSRLGAAPLLGLLGLAGCEAASEGSETDELLRSFEDETCTPHRQLARKLGNQAGCPAVANWIDSRLFPGATGALSRYCVYEWNGAGVVDAEDIANIGPSLHMSAPEPDCEIVLAQSLDPLSLAVAPLLRTIFLASINSPDPATLPVNPNLAPVEVAVIDTVPEPSPSAPNSPHGKFMADIIEDVACPDGTSCAVTIRRQLGLPRVQGGEVDSVRGGLYGSWLDLAGAIYRAVDEWEDLNGSAKLVLNLSVGWEPELYGVSGSALPVDAIHEALEYARCKRALIVVAAGNEGWLCATGPLLPGGFEVDAAPDVARCEELGVYDSPGYGPGYHPLVYSVGGLDLLDRRMPGTRVDGRPRLAATATHAIAGEGELTTALTGTSVASASVAGAAALVWSWHPGLSASEVMEQVYQKGSPRPTLADYAGANASSLQIRELDVCKALNLGQACTPATTTNMADVFAELGSIPHDDLVVPSFIHQDQCDPACGDPLIAHSTTVGDPCPEVFTPELPYTEPQPTQPACPNCTLKKSDGTIKASLDTAYIAEQVSNVGVEIVGATSVYFDLGQVDLSATTVTAIKLDPLLFPTDIRSATISIQFASPDLPRPQTNDLLLE